jgi:S-adenosylhomocysteine hydrolase
MTIAPHDVEDLSLAAAGQLRIDRAQRSRPVLRTVRERLKAEQPLRGIDELTPRRQESLASWTQGT